MNVLIVTHRKRSLDDFQVCLEDMGYRVHTAYDGRKPLGRQRSMLPEVMLAGIGTTEANGLDRLDTFRRQNPETSLVVVTDPANLEKVIEGVRLGAWDSLVTPWEDERDPDLTVRGVLERTRLPSVERDRQTSSETSRDQETRQSREERTERGQAPLDPAGSKACTNTTGKSRSAAKGYGPGCESVTGYTPRELAADSELIYRIVLEEDRPRVLDMVSRIFEAEVPLSFEYRMRHKNGSLRWVCATLVPHGAREGNAFFYDWIFVDITGSKQTSESALRFNEELERRVHERTIQLESANEEITTLNEDLVRRSQELEKANLQLESFSYSISHDLRTPLRHVHALSRMLQEQSLESFEESGKRYLGFIESGCQRMECLVNDLLKFSKLSLQPLVKTTVQTKDLACDVMAELTGETPERHVEVAIGDLPACQADISLLRQVFRNLLGNALKYSRKRESPRIEVGSMVRNDQTVYFVRDNGAGFNMEFAGKLFGVFQRLQHATEYEGTGVGLAIAQNIIQRHGGTIWAEAAEDNGATFYFTLARERC